MCLLDRKRKAGFLPLFPACGFRARAKMGSMKQILIIASLFAAAVAHAAPSRMEPAALRQVAEQFLQVQTAGLPGKVTVSVGAVDPRLNLTPCPAPEAFLMPGARAWGKTTVGVRCAAPSPWTVYIQSQVSVLGSYVAAAVPLAQGQAIEDAQLAMMQGELTALPAGIAPCRWQCRAAGRSVHLASSPTAHLRWPGPAPAARRRLAPMPEAGAMRMSWKREAGTRKPPAAGGRRLGRIRQALRLPASVV